jgi:hypothetical protein
LKLNIVVDVRENIYRAFLGVYTLTKLEKRLGSKYMGIKELGNLTRMMPPTLVNEEAGLEKIAELALKQDRIVLLCVEKLESDYQRGYVKRWFTVAYPHLVGLLGIPLAPRVPLHRLAISG